MTSKIKEMAICYRDASDKASESTDNHLNLKTDESEKNEKGAWVRRSLEANCLAREVLKYLNIEYNYKP